MDEVELQFFGVCMKTIYMKASKDQIDHFISDCRKNNLDISETMSSKRKINNNLKHNKDVHLLDKYFMYFNEIEQVSVSRNNLFTYSIHNYSFQSDIKFDNLSNSTKSQDVWELEKNSINDASITYKLDIDTSESFNLDETILPVFMSNLDGSLLCREIYYKDQRITPNRLSISHDCINTINLRYPGGSYSFLNMSCLASNSENWPYQISASHVLQ